MAKRWTTEVFYPEYAEGSHRGRDSAQAYKAVACNRDLLRPTRSHAAAAGLSPTQSSFFPPHDFVTENQRGVRRLMVIVCDRSRHRREPYALAQVWQTRQGLLYAAKYVEPRPPGSSNRPDHSHSDPLPVRVVRILLPPEPEERLYAKCTHGGLIQFDPQRVLRRLMAAEERLQDSRHVERVALTEVGPSAVRWMGRQ